MNNFEQISVLTPPKEVIKQIDGFKKLLNNSLDFVEKGKENETKINVKFYINQIISFCNENKENNDGGFGDHLSELAEAYENLKDQLSQLSIDQLKSQLSRMEHGRAAEGLNDFIKKNNINLN